MKIIKQENFRVIVVPLSRFAFVFKPDRKDCEELKKDIEKHCYFDSVEIRYDNNAFCSFCGNTWEVYDSGLPCCCTKAKKEFETQKESEEVR